MTSTSALDAQDEPSGLLADPPFTLHRPEPGDAAPLIFASPHSGRLYPRDMMAASALDEAAIRRSEDAFVDLLAAAGPRFGAPLIVARYARAYCCTKGTAAGYLLQ